MPIYEYRCEACGAELEKLQKINDPPLQDCPECGKAALTKLVSASSFRLKGSGWYETDFKTGDRKNGVKDATASTAPNADKADTGTAAKDNKPGDTSSTAAGKNTGGAVDAA